MRKIIVILGLSVISCFFSPLGAQALTSGCYTYTVSGSSATITDATACTGAITVPSTLGGNTVVALGAYAFRGAATVTSVTLPDTVITLSSYAFYQLPQLTYLNLGNGVATLSVTNVKDCPLLSTLLLGTGFRILGNYATSGDSSLTTLNLPAGTTTVNTYAFGNNSSVTTVTIPASVVNAQTYAFSNSNLTSINYAGYSGVIISQLGATFGNCGWTGPAACTSGPAFYLSSTSGLASTRSTFSGYSITTTRGTGTVYSVDPAISNGLSFSTATGRISGTPSADVGAVTYTITGTNSSGYATATYTFSVDSTHQYINCSGFFMSTSLHVQRNDSIIFNNCFMGSIAGVNNSVISNISTVSSGGYDTYTILISNSVSPGTYSNAFTLTTMGTPTQFNIIIDSSGPAAPAFTISSSSESATAGTPLAGYTISSTGGAIASYSISPAIGNGLSFSTSTGLISGTPTAAASTVSYIITATNATSTATRSFALSVSAALAAPAFTISARSESVVKGSTVVGYTITSTGGTVASYAISPAFSNGTLAFNTSTGLISGAPTVSTSAVIYTITAHNATTPDATTTFTLTVVDPTPIPDPVQQSKISSIAPVTAVALTSTPVVVTGSFVEKISAIQINGVGLATGSWTQTSTTISFTVPGKATGIYSIQIYNGSAPVMTSQNFTFTAPPAVPTIVAAPKQKVKYIRCTRPGHGTWIAYGVNPVCPAKYSGH